MARYIDADALIPMMKYATTDSEVGIFPIKIGFNDIVKVINDMPTADVRENVGGEWIMTEDDGSEWMCNKCSELVYSRSNYCPYCGADMRSQDA